jgi:hypothetical protein
MSSGDEKKQSKKWDITGRNGRYFVMKIKLDDTSLSFYGRIERVKKETIGKMYCAARRSIRRDQTYTYVKEKQ